MVLVVDATGMHTHAIDLGISLLIVFAFGAGGCRPVCPSLSFLSIQYIALGIVNIY